MHHLTKPPGSQGPLKLGVAPQQKAQAHRPWQMLLRVSVSLGTQDYFIKCEGVLASYPGLRERFLWSCSRISLVWGRERQSAASNQALRATSPQLWTPRHGEHCNYSALLVPQPSRAPVLCILHLTTVTLAELQSDILFQRR